MRARLLAGSFLFSLLAAPTPLYAAASVISQYTSAPQPYTTWRSANIVVNDSRFFVATGTLSSVSFPAAIFKGTLLGTDTFQMRLYNYYYGQILDCKSPIKTVDEWGISKIPQDQNAPMVTIGPFTGTQCQISSRALSSGEPNAIMTWPYRNGSFEGNNIGMMGSSSFTNFTAYGPPIPDAPPKPKNSNILFFPGIEASRLYEPMPCASGMCEVRLWEPSGDALTSRLAQDANGASLYSDIYVKKNDIIDTAYLPLKGDIYKSFITQMNTLVATGTIHEWEAIPYDWRLPLDQILQSGSEIAPGKISYLTATSSPYIIQELRRLAQSSQTGKVTIIAHSNGGLLTKALVTLLGIEASKLIDKIIFVAVPEVGTPQAIGALLHGYDQSLPIKLLSFAGMSETAARTLAHDMPSVYNLLPSSNYFTYTDNPVITFSADALLAPWRATYGDTIHSGERLHTFLVDQSRTVLPVSDPLISPEVGSEALLNTAEHAHTTLDAWTPPTGIEMTEIAGWGEETLSTIAYYQGLKSTCIAYSSQSTCTALLTTPALQYRPITVLDGDGTVLAPSALWTQGVKRYWVDLQNFNKQILFSSRKHSGILEVPQLRTLIQNIITNASTTLPQFISTAIPVNTRQEKQLNFTLHSPLSLNLYDAFGNHTGFSTTTNTLEESIPGSRYFSFGEVQYITVPASSNPHLFLNGYALGSFTLDIAEVQGTTILASTTFAAIPSSPDTTASIAIPTGTIAGASPLRIDENADGVPDLTLSPELGGVVIADFVSPEAVLSFSTTTKTIAFSGVDNLSSLVSVSSPFILTDEAGNTTTLLVDKKKEERGDEKIKKERRSGEVEIGFSKIIYSTPSTTTHISLPKNAIHYEWEVGASGVLTKLEQQVRASKDFSVHAVYDAKKNETEIFVKEKENDEKLKEARSGLTLLRLVTNKGKFDFEY